MLHANSDVLVPELTTTIPEKGFPSVVSTAACAPIPDLSLSGMLEETLARIPSDAPAMDFLGKTTTYGQLRDKIDRAARGFQVLGVCKGVPVGLCLPNSPFFVIAYFGILKAGGTVVNFNPLYTENEMRGQANDSGVTIMVALDQKEIFARVSALCGTTDITKIIVCSLASELPRLKGMLYEFLKRDSISKLPDDPRFVSWKDFLSDQTPPQAVSVDSAHDIAVIQYTGGTTGVSKGAMLSHSNLVANVVQMKGVYPHAEFGRERVMCVIPFFHVFAMTVVMNYGLFSGAELIIVPRFDIDETMKIIEERRPTLFAAVPTIFTAILASVETNPLDMSSLRFCMSGGAPLPVEIKERFEEKTRCVLVEGYGLSESSPIATCNPPGGLVKAGSIGKPVPGTVIEIRSPHDPDVIMPMGDRGEICIRGPQVMMGYWGKPDATANVTVDGALRTGDIGYIDEDGYIFLVDRIKDIILCGGYNVYPRMIEEALYQHPDVVEVIVIGLPDSYRGEAPKAYVQLMDGALTTEEELLAFLKPLLNKIEMPRDIEIRDRLPRTAVGKLSKKMLRDEAMADLKRLRESEAV